MENYNMDLSRRVVIDTENHTLKSFQPNGTFRIPLESESRESGRLTSIVKFTPGAKLDQSTHSSGEEIVVLEGVLSDEQENYPAGTYLRIPPGDYRIFSSKQGCKIFRKSNQLLPLDTENIVINTNNAEWHPGHGNLEVMPLSDNTALVKWPKGAVFVNHSHYGGEEIFVLKGKFNDEHGSYPKGTWIRSPHLSTHFPFVEEETIIFVKTGHLLSKTD